MYLWKVWFRPDPLPTGVPRAIDAQCHRVSSPKRVLTGNAQITAWRIYLTLSGLGRAAIGDREITLPPGHAVAVHLNDPALIVRPERLPWTFIHVTIEDDCQGRSIASLIDPLRSTPIPSELVDRISVWRSAYRRVVRAHPQDPHLSPVIPVHGIETFALAADLLTVLGRARANTADASGAAQRVVDAARSVVQSSRRLDLSAKELASALKISRKHLSWAFAACGLPGPYRWLRQQRMQQAATLLLDDDREVSQIARAMGFRDPSAFTRVFRSVHGRTPVAWRREHRAG